MNAHSPSITFYSVPERGVDPIDWCTGRDREKLLKYLASEGTRNMRVKCNGDDVTFQIARDLATQCGQIGEYASGYHTVFSEFAQHFAPDRCDEMWAEIERDHEEFHMELNNSAWGKWA